MENKKRIVFGIIGVFLLIMALVGVTYAYFNYTRTGVANNIATGNIYFNTEQNSTLNLTNAFPLTSEEAENANLPSLSLSIKGDTTFDEGEEYKISFTGINNTINGKTVPITYIATVSNIGDSSDNYWTARGGNSTIYSLTTTGEVSNDEQILVGYIAKGETGINGTLQIKAYIDANKVAISDTYDGTESESMGTTNEWVAGRTVFTTEEWRSFKTNPISFKIKAEANEGVWVEEPPTALNTIKKNVIIPATPINFGEISSDTNGKGVYMLPGTENDTNPIYYYRGAVDNNNVIFGGFCWQMVRTTDTGGIKMIYNGVATSDGTTCENTADVDKSITSNKFNTTIHDDDAGLSDVGYMSNKQFIFTRYGGTTFGKNVEWNGTEYLVIDDTPGVASTNNTLDNNHHYGCDTGTTCSTVNYYYYRNQSNTYITYYIVLSNGETIEDALYKMTGNGNNDTKLKNAGYELNVNNSNAKSIVDNWFKTNLTNEVDVSKINYQDYLEDTEYCNDRSFKTSGLNSYAQTGWKPDGGALRYHLYFGAHNRYNNNWYSDTNVPSMTCPNEIDRFTVSNSKGNGALTYPVGLITSDEVILAGASGNGDTSSNFYLYTSNHSLTMTPSFEYGNITSMFIENDGKIIYAYTNVDAGIRPVVSLKPGIEFVDGGEGTTTNPYVVKVEE